MLEGLFGSKLRVKILASLLNERGARPYIRELARSLGEEAKNVSRELTNLEALGVLRSETDARVRRYWADEEFPLYPQLREIFVKTYGYQRLLSEALQPCVDVAAAFVFGSYARGEETPTSDVDLFVVGEISAVGLHSRVRAVEQRLGRTVNHVLFPRTELRDKLHKGDHFVSSVMRGPKVFVKGTEAELRAITEPTSD